MKIRMSGVSRSRTEPSCLREAKKHLVLLLLDPRCFFPSSGCCRVLVHRDASLSKEWLILFTVRARIDPPEIAHMLVLPFKLLLQVVLLRLVRFRRSVRRFIRATSNQQFRSFLHPRTSSLIYLPSLEFIPCSNLSLTRFLSSSMIFFLSHCCKFNISNVFVSRPSFISLSICASV